MLLRQTVATLLILGCSASLAIAQDDEKTACYDRIEGQDPANTFLNKGMTDYWRQMLRLADQKLMGQLAGTYHAVRTSPDGVYSNEQERNFDANGLFAYKDQTCTIGTEIPCSTNQGAGEWRAVNQTDGTTYVMIRFTDIRLTDACAGERITLGTDSYTDEGGVLWQKTG